MAGTPNPGSDEARAAGCKCPVLDNNHGKFAPYPPDGWWMSEKCPVHLPQREGEDDQEVLANSEPEPEQRA